MNNIRMKLAKVAVLLVISLGLFWLLDWFSPVSLFEPQSKGWELWMSYANDLILPFAFYFFLWLVERWLKTWQARALLAFAVPTLLEFGQGLYPWVSASRYFTDRYVGAFDPLDILMYAIGVGLAVLVEQLIFAKLLKFWQQQSVALNSINAANR
jgi:glycopeptide antibiotics resistance protein